MAICIHGFLMLTGCHFPVPATHDLAEPFGDLLVCRKEGGSWRITVAMVGDFLEIPWLIIKPCASQLPQHTTKINYAESLSEKLGTRPMAIILTAAVFWITSSSGFHLFHDSGSSSLQIHSNGPIWIARLGVSQDPSQMFP